MAKRKLYILLTVILCTIGITVAAFFLLPSENDTPDTEPTEQEGSQPTFRDDIKAQTAGLNDQFRAGSLEFTDDNKDDYFFLLSIYENASDFENAIIIAKGIPNSADEVDVQAKYSSLLQSTRISQKFQDYEKYRAEYIEYLVTMPSQTIENTATFDDRYPTREEVEAQFEDNDIEDQV